MTSPLARSCNVSSTTSGLLMNLLCSCPSISQALKGDKEMLATVGALSMGAEVF